MADENILDLMLNHHALLWTLFISFRDAARENSPDTAKAFSELKWETKKHFFTEENAIFDYIPMKNMGVLETINQLKDEHITMLGQLENISNSLPELKIEVVDKFQYLLESHREMEEKKLYPKLDKELNKIQKHQIVSRIEQIPISNYKK